MSRIITPDDPRRKELFKIMKSHAKNHGGDRLPIEEYVQKL